MKAIIQLMPWSSGISVVSGKRSDPEGDGALHSSEPDRDQFLELVEILGESVDPYSIAAAVLAEDLALVAELRQEMGEFLDDLVALARVEKVLLPEELVDDARQEIHKMGYLRTQLELQLLFGPETRQRCGQQAVPLLALTLFRVWNWVDYGTKWLESVDRLRYRVDAILAARFSGHSRDHRYRRRRKPEDTPTAPATAVVVE